MIISDEKLSAFLDAELPQNEMDELRELMLGDESLADRMAEFALVDQLLIKTYSQINEVAVPDKIMQLLTDKTATIEPAKNAQIIAFPWWKKARQAAQHHVAIAASLMLMLGYGSAVLMQPKPATMTASVSPQIQQVLENQISGQIFVIDQSQKVLPRATFKNLSGQYCRQYQSFNNQSKSENIACRKQGQWELLAMVKLDNLDQTDQYQTASGGTVLDVMTEQMIQGNFFNRDNESTIISNHWDQ